jgi:oligopeptide transport system substrate-binding protein
MFKPVNKLFLSFVFSAFVAMTFSSCTKKAEEKGAVLHLATIAKIKGLDPAQAQDQYSSNEIMRIYEPLLTYHPWKRPYVLQPLLADGMPVVSKDGLTYTFKIRKGVKFHDDAAFPDGKGRELTAQDVVYSIKRIADPRNQSVGWWLFDGRIVGLNEWREKWEKQKDTPSDYSEVVPGLNALDANTVQFKLVKPFPQFLNALAMPYACIVAPEAVAKYGQEFLNHGVGTGPFVLETFKPAEVVTYVKNTNYWGDTYPTDGAPGDKEAGLLADAGKPLPLVDRVEVRIITEDQPRWMHFVKGDTEISTIPKDNFNQVMLPGGDEMNEEFKAKGLKLIKEAQLDLTYTAFNLEAEKMPFKDKRVRQALSLALDEDEAIKLFYNNMARGAQTVIPPGISGYDPDYVNPYRSNDLEKAKKLLAEAGYPDGKGFPEITYDGMADTTARQMGDYTAKKLAQLNIKINYVGNTWPALLEKVQKRNVHMWGIAWGADYPDAENFLQLFYGKNATPGGMNGSYYKNPAFDSLFEKARIMSDSPERTKYYQQLAKMLAEDCPVILGVHRLALSLRHPWVSNYKVQEFPINTAKYIRIDLDVKKQFKK